MIIELEGEIIHICDPPPQRLKSVKAWISFCLDMGPNNPRN